MRYNDIYEVMIYEVMTYMVYQKNGPLCFLYISAPIKATEIVFIWEDRGDPIVHFEYKTNSER